LSKEFIVCDDKKQTWFLVEAEAVEEAVNIASNKGFEPYFVMERSLATKVWEEKQMKARVIRRRNCC